MKKSKSSINRDDKRYWTPKRPGLLMALEPRILYDGAGAEVAADGAAESMVPQISEHEAVEHDQAADAPEVSGQEQDPASQQAEDGADEQESAEPATGEDLETTASGTSEEPQDESVTDTVNEGEDAAADSQASDATEEQSPTEATADSETETVTGEEATSSEPVAVTETSDDSLTDTTAAEDDCSELTVAAVEPELPTEDVREIVFVDNQVEDYETLVSGIVGEEAEYAPESPYTLVGDRLIVTLGDNPLDQMDAVLAHYQGLEAIHIVSHGDQGELILGDEHITTDTLSQYDEHIRTWGSALSEDGDLLLYGCTVAADGAGQEFVDSIAALSGADVAASDDATGNADQGGDWELEVTTGPIEAASVLNDQNAADWQGLLALSNTGTWAVTPSGSNATAVNTTAGITTTITCTTETSNSSFFISNTTLNTLGDIYTVPSATGTPDPGGNPALAVNFTYDTTRESSFSPANVAMGGDGGTGLITITFSKPVTDPVLHLDRLAGATSAYLTGVQLDLLTPGITLVRLDGTDHFEVSGNTISNSQEDMIADDVNASTPTSKTVDLGAAAGSILLQGTFTTLTFRVQADLDSYEGTANDTIGMAFTFSPVDLGPVVDLNSSPADTTSVNTTTTSVNLVTSGNFGTTAVATPAGWTETGSNGTVVNGRYVWNDAPAQALTQTISAPATVTTEQSISGGVLTTTTTEISYDIKQIAFDIAWQNADTAAPSDNILRVSYGGTMYATFETGEGSGTTGTWTYYNGATGNLTTPLSAVTDETTGGMTHVTITLPDGVVGASAPYLRFTYMNGSTGAGSDDIAIDNVAVMADRTVTTTTTTIDLVNVNYAATFTEGSAPVAIADVDSSVFDVDSASMQSATITLTNPQTGDQLLVGGSAAASGTLANGVQWTRTDTVVTFTNIDSKADYADAIEQVQFNNTSTTPNSSITRDITVRVTDEARTISGVTSSNTSNTAHCYITVVEGDSLPVAVNDTITVTGNTPASGTLAANDTPSADGGNVWAVATSPTSGSVTIDPATGSYTYTPGADFTDSDSFTYTITDADGDVSTATVTIQGDSDGDGVVNATDIDDDNDGILDTVEQASHAYADLSHATLTWNVAGTVGTLSGIQIGEATGTLTITAVGGASISANLATGGYAAPQFTPEGPASLVDLSILSTLSNNSGRSIVYELTFDQPVYDLTFHLRGVDYNQIQFTGSHVETLLSGGTEFTYNSTTRTLFDSDPTVGTSVNVPSRDGYGSVRITAADGGPLTSISFRGIDAPNSIGSSDGWQLTFSGVSDVDTDGDGIVDRLDIDSDNDGITDNVEAQTTAGYIAPTGTGAAMVDTDNDGLDDAYDATASGGAAGSLGLTPVNTDSADLADWRDADSDNDGKADITERGDGQPTSVTSMTDTDRDGLLDIFEAGTVNDGFDVNDENRTQTTLGLSGDAALLPDGSNAVPLTTDLLFRDVDKQPVAVDDAITVTEDTPLSGTLATNDTPSGDGGNVWAVATPPVNGTVIVNLDGTYTYTPDPNFNGSDSFTYTITDVDGDVSTATVNVTVNPVDDLPVAVDDAITVTEDTPLSGTLVTNDTPSGDGGNVWAVATPPANGTVTVNPDGSYTYTPNANFNGSDSFTYTITDGDGDVSTATVTVTVNPVDDLPVAVDDAITVTEDTPVSGTLAGNDTPSGDGGNVWAVATPPANGTVTVNPDGTYTYTPNPDFNGSDSFTYTVTDVDGDVSTATVTVTVNPVDDLPVAVDDAITVTEDTPVSGTLAGNDTPSGDGGNVWAVAIPPANGTVIVNPDGSYTYTPNANFNGSDSFTYTITDGDGDVSTATVTVTVNPVDDLPVAVDDAITVTEDTPLSGTLATNDTP